MNEVKKDPAKIEKKENHPIFEKFKVKSKDEVLPKKITDLEQQVAKLKLEKSEVENKMKRAVADYLNLQDRVTRERVQLTAIAKEEAVRELLPVLDNLRRASTVLKDQGLDFVVKQFATVLENMGVMTFDPHQHECIEVVVGVDNKLVEVLEKGYKVGEKVIRPAKVKVGKKQ